MRASTSEREAKQTIKAASACIFKHISSMQAATKPLRSNPGDSKAIHDLRVAARRSLTALDIYASFIDDDFSKQLKRNINRLRRQCGEIRDREILLRTIAEASDRLTEPELLAAYTIARKIRKQLHKQRLKTSKRLKAGAAKKIARRATKYFARPEIAAQQSGKLSEFAPMVIARELKDIYKLYELADQDETFASTHRLRRQFKKLRYTLDSFQTHLPIATPSPLRATLTEAQDILGKLADFDMIVHRLAKFQKRLKSPSDAHAAGLALLSARFSLALERQHDIFLQFWHVKIAAGYGYDLLTAWGLRESTARWMLGKSKIVALAKPKSTPRLNRKPAVMMG